MKRKNAGERRIDKSGGVRFVAFLRAVNVGGRTVKSPQLVDVFHSLGYANVATFLASGNVVFDAAGGDAKKLQGEIEPRLEQQLGFTTEVFLRTIEEIAELAELDPFQLDDAQQKAFNVNVVLLQQAPTAALRKRIAPLRSDYDDFHFAGREMLWLCRGKMSDSPLFPNNRLVKAIDALHTVRNQRTLARLAAKFGITTP